MEPYNDGWLYSGSARDRLWNKSAIGKKINNKLLLTSSEVIFCHNHRHIDWPNNEWFADEIIKNPDSFIEKISNRSFFENEKLVIISRSTDRIFIKRI